MSKDCLRFRTLYGAYKFHEKIYPRRLESIVTQQTDFPFELLVNDDASTDGTPPRSSAVRRKVPGHRAPVLSGEKNLYSQDIDIYYAPCSSRTRAANVAFCEGDDYWTDPTKLQRQVDFLKPPESLPRVHNRLLHYAPAAAGRRSSCSAGDCDVEFEDIPLGMSTAWH